MAKNLRITTRFDENERKSIEQLIASGSFENISQVIRTALKQFLKDKGVENASE